jgi:hypothetical protein
MFRLFLTAAFVVGMGSAAFANQISSEDLSPNVVVNYTFTGYCDGVNLSQVNGIAQGYHTGSCEAPFPRAGGFKVHRPNISDPLWTITTTDTGAPDYQLVFVLDERALTWTSWWEDTVLGIAFQELNSGTLTIGAPPIRPFGLRPSSWSALPIFRH